MSHAQPSVQDAPVVDPAAAEPVTTTAPEASTDPVRPMATDSLNAESRPELNTAGDVPASAATKATVIPPKEEKISKNEILVEAQPINEGVLGYKAPGLVK